MKKNPQLKKLAMMGIAGGVLIAQSSTLSAHSGWNDNKLTADATETTNTAPSTKMMTEQELMSQLNDQGKATYQGLNQDGKNLALKLASQSCKGQNTCKGMNSCKTAENACAGQGGCKGTSKGPFTDKNQAVKVAAQRMADKRASMNNGQ